MHLRFLPHQIVSTFLLLFICFQSFSATEFVPRINSERYRTHSIANDDQAPHQIVGVRNYHYYPLAILTDTLTMAQKGEKLFQYIPVPLYSYSKDAGNVFGLAKFNLVDFYKNDTVTRPSLFSGVFTVSTLGRINFSLNTQILTKENKFVLLAYFNYKKTPEYIFGIGNDVKREDVEQVTIYRAKFVATGMFKCGKYLYAGGGIDIANYFGIETDSNSFLIRDHVSGLNGGTNVGVGLASAYDSRDSRYNPSKGAYVLATYLYYGNALGSKYKYYKFEVDARKFYNPWLRHVIAMQVTTSAAGMDVPFYELSMLGGENQMRGYYKGALRDNILADCQVEYRMPVWKMFGVTGWVGTGRVAHSYDQMSLNGLWLDYGIGLRIRVDTKHNTNLRMDYGMGPHNISGFYINFAEAF